MVLGSFSLKNHISPKYSKTPDRYVFSNCVKLCLLGTIPSLSLLRTFWYQDELPKSFGSRDKILPKYGHRGPGVAVLGFFANFLKPFLKGKILRSGE